MSISARLHDYLFHLENHLFHDSDMEVCKKNLILYSQAFRVWHVRATYQRRNKNHDGIGKLQHEPRVQVTFSY